MGSSYVRYHNKNGIKDSRRYQLQSLKHLTSRSQNTRHFFSIQLNFLHCIFSTMRSITIILLLILVNLSSLFATSYDDQYNCAKYPHYVKKSEYKGKLAKMKQLNPKKCKAFGEKHVHTLKYKEEKGVKCYCSVLMKYSGNEQTKCIVTWNAPGNGHSCQCSSSAASTHSLHN